MWSALKSLYKGLLSFHQDLSADYGQFSAPRYVNDIVLTGTIQYSQVHAGRHFYWSKGRSIILFCLI